METDSDVLIIGFDIGTALSAVAYTIARSRSIGKSKPTIANSTNQIFPVRFAHGTQVSSQLAWDPRQRCWAWGDAVDDMVENGEIDDTDRIEMIKLCLDTSGKTQNTRTKVEKQLNSLPEDACKEFGRQLPSAQDLMGVYLKFLWDTTVAEITNCYSKSRSGNIFQRVSRVCCWISVPKLWTPSMNRAMAAAATWAGIPNVDLVHEPEAAAAFCLLGQQIESAGSDTRGSTSLDIGLLYRKYRVDITTE